MTVVPFRALDAGDVELVGGKSANLGELVQAGFPVPPGFAVTAQPFAQIVQPHAEELLAGLDPEDVGELERRAEKARQAVEALHVPDEITAAIADGYAELAVELELELPPVAVRSSAVAEDAEGASFAGMQSTYLWLRGADVVLAGIRRCWASYFNAEAVAYRARHGGAAGMSVAVQAMVDARVAGVMFTLNPVTGDPSSVAIDAGYGLGVSVAEGDVTPDSYLVSKVTREIVRTEIGSKELECIADPDGGGTLRCEVDPERRARPCLEPEDIARLVELARAVERHYGRAQDLEWAIDRRGELFLLQARPETVWTDRPRAEVAESPLAAIAQTYLGGRRPR